MARKVSSLIPGFNEPPVDLMRYAKDLRQDSEKDNNFIRQNAWNSPLAHPTFEGNDFYQKNYGDLSAQIIGKLFEKSRDNGEWISLPLMDIGSEDDLRLYGLESLIKQGLVELEKGRIKLTKSAIRRNYLDYQDHLSRISRINDF